MQGPRPAGHGRARRVVRRQHRRGRHRHVAPAWPAAAGATPAVTCRCRRWPSTATRPRSAAASTRAAIPSALDLDQVARDAVERAVQLFGATKPPSSKLAIVLEPRFAATVLGIVGGMLTGERVLKGRSPFADRVGEAIASPLLSLVDDPTDQRSLAADPYDGEGLATPPQRADRRRPAVRVPAEQLHRPPVGHALDRLGGARLPIDARASGCRPSRSRPARARSTS